MLGSETNEMTAANVVLERDSPNDEEGIVSAVIVPSGALVRRGEHIFDVENSKAVQEIYSPCDGVLEHILAVGTVVKFGTSVAQILPESVKTLAVDAGVKVAGSQPDTPKEPPEYLRARKVRLSQKASAVAASHGLSASDFHTDFVTVRDVLSHVGPSLNESTTVPLNRILRSAAVTAFPVIADGAEISVRKREEIRVLSRGAGATMLSVVGLRLGPISRSAALAGFFADRIADLIIYEASRLMHRYPKLNATFGEHGVKLYQSINGGIAFDDGGRLMVYGIENSDELSLKDIQSDILGALERYATSSLTAKELLRSTFTVTDLSSSNIDFVFPLLPENQSAIIGVTKSEQGFALYLGFDHRVTEGLYAAGFLRELADRIISFALLENGEPAPICSFCGTALGTIVEELQERGLMKIVDRHGAEVLCCNNCWTGC
jgi:pyruvate/2-oxoglutarate dehydrogenase complex dihydrolipoamide acyltransferase (E2) component